MLKIPKFRYHEKAESETALTGSRQTIRRTFSYHWTNLIRKQDGIHMHVNLRSSSRWPKIEYVFFSNLSLIYIVYTTYITNTYKKFNMWITYYSIECTQFSKSLQFIDDLTIKKMQHKIQLQIWHDKNCYYLLLFHLRNINDSTSCTYTF